VAKEILVIPSGYDGGGEGGYNSASAGRSDPG